MLEQLCAKALPVYSHFFLEEVNYNRVGFSFKTDLSYSISGLQ